MWVLKYTRHSHFSLRSRRPGLGKEHSLWNLESLVTGGVELSLWPSCYLILFRAGMILTCQTFGGRGTNAFLRRVHIPWTSLFCILTKTLRSLSCSAEEWAGQQLCEPVQEAETILEAKERARESFPVFSWTVECYCLKHFSTYVIENRKWGVWRVPTQRWCFKEIKLSDTCSLCIVDMHRAKSHKSAQWSSAHLKYTDGSTHTRWKMSRDRMSSRSPSQRGATGLSSF